MWSTVTFILVILTIHYIAENDCFAMPVSDNTRNTVLCYSSSELRMFKDAANPSALPTIPTEIRKKTKRGKKAGIRCRMRKRKTNPFMPPITFGNCRALKEKIDYLRLNCRFLHQYREASCIALTETWLKDSLPDSAMDITNFTMIRADRSQVQTNKEHGGGLALYINDSWYNNIQVKHQSCSPDLEILSVNLRPTYLPREFTNIFITVVYIPPSSNKELAAEQIRNIENELSTEKPDSVQIILGDVNHTRIRLPSNFKQYVNCTTREDNILDHFYCNINNAYRCVKGPKLKNSDHHMLHMQPTYTRKLKQQKPVEITKSIFTPDNIEILNSSFDQTDWNILIDTSSDVDELTDVVTEYLKFNIDMLIPTKTLKKFPNNKPWINSSLRKHVVDLHSMFTNHNPQYDEKLQEVNAALIHTKLEYKNKVENLFKQNRSRDAWKGLNMLTGRNKSQKECALLNPPGSADRLNSFYARFDDKDFSHEHNSIKRDLAKLAAEEDPITVSEEEVIHAFNRLNVKKASGPDKIGALILKKCMSSLLYIVHSLFELSVQACKMPKIWKLGEIIPISKKPLPKIDNDLRPITLTAILSKTFERVMLPKLKFFIMPKIDNLQFAYLDKRSTEDAMNTLLHFTTSHLDNPGTYARCLFIDYSSAFNTIQPHILLSTLNTYKVPANLQLWILDFLTDRNQYVKTNKENSSVLCINTGGPQGCVLSAFLFVIYTNLLSRNNQHCKIIKYADDTVVVGLIENNDESHYRSTVQYVVEWCDSNFLNLNVSKTKEMVLDFRRNKNNKEHIAINGSDVEFVPSYKYLGCTLQEDLSWDTHINNQVKKANKRLYHVRCLRKVNVCGKLISMFYNSVVSSVLMYAVACWYNSSTEKNKNDIKRFHKKVCRMLPGKFHSLVESADDVHAKQCINLAKRIMSDPTHPLYSFFRLLPSGRRLNVIPSCTNRSHNTFVITAIKLYNSM